jgi:hypothetical protein
MSDPDPTKPVPWRRLSCLLVVACLAALGCSSSDDVQAPADEGSGGAGGEGGGGGGGTAAPTCETYCAQVKANCEGDLAVYASDDICMSTCGAMPVGTLDDVSGNTLGCRQYHSGAAAMDAATHCPHAGPGGAGFCGSNCESYCSLMATVCKGEYADDAECMATCETFVDTEPFSANIKSGNTLQCRLYHLSVATTDNIHCGHVGAMPADGTCTD